MWMPSRGGSPVSTPAWPWRRDRLFFSGMAIAAAIVVFAGFAPTYYLKAAFGAPKLSPLLHLRLIFTGWIVLFVVQARLIAGRRTPLHRPRRFGRSPRSGHAHRRHHGRHRLGAPRASHRRVVRRRSRSDHSAWDLLVFGVLVSAAL